jgi:hypothetical protein
MELTLKEAYDQWKTGNKRTTVKSLNGKLEPIITAYGDIDVREVLTESILNEYIFTNTGELAKHKRSAFVHFCNFVFNILFNEKNYVFPLDISLEKVENFDKERTSVVKPNRKTFDINYFPPEFELEELLNDKHYRHIEDTTAITTLKAVISLCLTVPIGLEFITDEKESEKYIRLSDVSVDDDGEVIISLRNENAFVSDVHISSKASNYLFDYHKLRIGASVETDAYFTRMWPHGSFKWDKQVLENTSYKPYNVHTSLLYLLRYICTKLDYPNVTIDSLRNNVIFNWLVTSRGTALNEIVNLCGMKQPFVAESYRKFIEYATNNCSGYDFFKSASSHLENEKMVDSDEVAMSIISINRRIRDTEEAKKLKVEYYNTCQICNEKITIAYRLNYSEAHHIQPLGGEHKGPDNRKNLIVLCPNHHAMFDLGVIAIDPNDGCTILHIDEKNKLNGDTVKQMKHSISSTYLRYHYKNIFMVRKEMLVFSLREK